ncbi:MAG: hypothetical protein ACR2RB_15760, partial [Gammaproteobacteria bacterium]
MTEPEGAAQIAHTGFGFAHSTLLREGLVGLVVLAFVGLVALMGYVVLESIPRFEQGQTTVQAALTTLASEIAQERVAIQANRRILADVELTLEKLRELDMQQDKMGGILFRLQRKMDRILMTIQFA